MPKSQFKERRGKTLYKYDFTGECGFVTNSKCEKTRAIIIKLHSKKCEVCRNINLTVVNTLIDKIKN